MASATPVVPSIGGGRSRLWETVEGTEPITCCQGLLIVMVALIPNIAIVALFSDLGFGLHVYSFLAPDIRNLIGNAVIGFTAMLVCLFFILDWLTWARRTQAMSAFIAVYLVLAGGILKARYYPQAPLVIILFHVPAGLGLLRMFVLAKVLRSSFYKWVTHTLFAVGLLVLGIWLVWILYEDLDGGHEWNRTTKLGLVESSDDIYNAWKIDVDDYRRSIVHVYDCDEEFRLSYDYLTNVPFTSKEKEQRANSCARAKTTWFLAWLTPFIASSVDIILGIFCVINSAYLDPDMTKLEKVLKRFVLMIAVVVLCMWVSAAVGAASMRLSGVLMAFCGAGLLALVGWIIMKVGLAHIQAKVQDSDAATKILMVARNDWTRACMIIGLNVLLPTALFVNILCQKVRRQRGTTNTRSLFTEEAEGIISSVVKWNWASILSKANLLVELYFLLSIGVAKLTYVFLSWLNETLLEIELGMVLLIFFVIGWTMFMLPPVPGIPVYICSGIVIAARCRSIDAIGFWGGTGIAVAMSFVLKLLAVCGQYSLGYVMGKKVSVQKFVGVDKVPTRAIEQILQVRGLSLGKVSVLVGGPDWPTSVLCGILKLNLCQCLLGTTPVILVSSPCVLAGAFISGPDDPNSDGAKESKSGMWQTLASAMLGASAMCQLVSGVLALYFIQDVASNNEAELSKERPEHEPVAELTRREAAARQAYKAATAWSSLSPVMKSIIAVSTIFMVQSLFIFQFMDEACFRPFQVSNRIGDDYDNQGLDNNAVNLVKLPGWGALGMFTIAFVLHWLFVRISTRRATEILRTQGTKGSDGPRNAW